MRVYICADLGGPEVDVEVDELTVLLHQVGQGARLQEVMGLLLQVQTANNKVIIYCTDPCAVQVS